MAVKYGPIYTIRLGIHRVLVINSWDIAKEIFTTHDSIVLSRPNFTAAKILGYSYVMFGVAPYGPYWKEMRKIVSFELLSSRRLEQAKHVRVSELETSIRNLHELWTEKKSKQGKVIVDMQKWFGELDMNVMFRMVVGRRYSEGSNVQEDKEMNRVREVMREFFHYLGIFVVADAVSWIGWLDLGGHEKAMKRVAGEIDCMIGRWLEEHRRKRESVVVKGNDEKDFMDVMLEAVETGGLKGFDADAVIKSACLVCSHAIS